MLTSQIKSLVENKKWKKRFAFKEIEEIMRLIQSLLMKTRVGWREI